MLSREAIRPELAPPDGDFRFNISDLEAMLPAGTVDHAAERIYPEVILPSFGMLGMILLNVYIRVCSYQFFGTDFNYLLEQP